MQQQAAPLSHGGGCCAALCCAVLRLAVLAEWVGHGGAMQPDGVEPCSPSRLALLLLCTLCSPAALLLLSPHRTLACNLTRTRSGRCICRSADTPYRSSPLRAPIVQAGIEPDSEEELSVQEAYTPESTCWGCGEWVLITHAQHMVGFHTRGCNGSITCHAARSHAMQPDCCPPIACASMGAAPLAPEHSCQWRAAPPAGPAAADGLMLRSYRIPGGLEASIELHPKYCAFPGQCSWQGVAGKSVHLRFEREGRHRAGRSSQILRHPGASICGWSLRHGKCQLDCTAMRRTTACLTSVRLLTAPCLVCMHLCPQASSTVAWCPPSLTATATGRPPSRSWTRRRCPSRHSPSLMKCW